MEDPQVPDEHLTSAMEAHTDPAEGFVIHLGEDQVPIFVLPLKKWPTRALHDLNSGDIEGWAELTLDDENYDKWCDAEPTIADAEQFFDDLQDKLSMDPNLSRQQRRRLKNTRKR